MASDALIPVNLITGFLGSGKTTLLKRLLQGPGMGRTAVLINEFGEVGLDHYLLERLDEATVLLKSGCLCCTIRGDLRDAIRDLYDRCERGTIPTFDRLIIETTGLADPAPIVATLLADPVIRHHFRLGKVVTVVDALNGLANLEAYEESRKQAAVADRLVVSKTDLAESNTTRRLRDTLARLNPTAPQQDSARDEVHADDLLASDLYDPKGKSAEVRHWLKEAGAAAVPDEGHGHDVNRHGADIRAFCLTLEAPLDWSAFALWLTMLINRYGAQILRLKGLLHIAGVDTPVVIHGVQHTVHPPVHLAAWPEGDRRTRLVFIAKGLARDRLEASLAAFNRPATAAAPRATAAPARRGRHRAK
jgi:G3E family GTPase